MNTILELEHIQKYYGNEGNIASVDKGIHNKTTKYGLPTY